MKTFGSALALISVLVTTAAVRADDSTQEALRQTQQLLLDAQQRQGAIQQDAKAREAADYVHNLTGGDAAKSQQVYSISADVMGDLVQQSGGDATKMQAMLEQAAKNPEAFANSLSPEQKAKLRSLASTLENPTPRAP